jgi:hypothetical protein
MVGLSGCWGEPDDPIDAIYSYNAEIERTLTGILVAGQGYVDELHVDTINYSNGYWDDARTPVTAVKTSATKPPDWLNYSAGQVLSFGDEPIAGNEESVSFVIQFPHGKEANSPIEMHVHYILPAAAAGNQVRWKLEYSWASVNEALPATQTLYALTLATADADTHYMTSFGFIDGTGKGMSSMLIGTLTRNSSNALDNYALDAYLLEIDAHYLMDRPGSEEYDH